MRNCISFNNEITTRGVAKRGRGVGCDTPTCQGIVGKIELLSGKMRKGGGGNERERERK